VTLTEWKRERRVKKSVYTYVNKRLLAGVPQAEMQRFIRSLDAQKLLDFAAGQDLSYEAWRFDVEVPPATDTEMWTTHEEMGDQPFLTPKGRLHLRKLIDGEKARRFEITTLWVKLLLPVIVALAGLLGTIAGLVAVLHRK
jgi:hypothetical protein